jgi:hypothetical protein
MKKTVFSLAAFVACFSVFAQVATRTTYYEAGISVGGMNSRTDVSRKLHWGSTRLNGSLFAGLLYKNTIGVRLEFTTGSVKASDSNNVDDLKARNLSFKSSITEFALVGEFHPLMINGWDSDKPPKFSPYIMAGIGFFSFNPQANLNSKWIDLEPLRLEGQGFTEYPERQRYKLNALCFPLGLGIKTELNQTFNLRLEGLYRFTTTDYLDDVSTRIIDPLLFDKYLDAANASIAKQLYNRANPANTGYRPGNQRGNPKYKDGYFNLNIKLGYCFGRQYVAKR